MEPRKEITLADYLGENQVLLTSLAVFATIAALTQSLEPKWIGGAVSFFCIAAMVLIWHEINSKCQRPPGTKTKLFRYIMQWGFYALITYWLINYRTFWKLFLILPIMFAIAYWITSKIISVRERTGWLKKLIGTRDRSSTLQNKVLHFLVTLIVLVAFIGAVWISLTLNIIADGLATIK